MATLSSYSCILLLAFMGLCLALRDPIYDTKYLSEEHAQDKEFIRYRMQIGAELEKDPAFLAAISKATDEERSSGKIAEVLDEVAQDVRRKLDEIKREEVKHQRELLSENIKHMKHADRNDWNPIHMDDKDSFGKEDLRRLIKKKAELVKREEEQRLEMFKKYEMKKEHDQHEKMKRMTKEERAKEEKKIKAHHTKKHQKIHEPGHKAQFQEVWEKGDGLDPQSFDLKTFFFLHDKNSDKYLDEFEISTFFLKDLDKAYDENDPATDLVERNEEMRRMKEYVMKEMDYNKDGFISLDEFLNRSNKFNFNQDNEWKLLTEKEQFTDQEFLEFEALISGKTNDEL